MSFSRKFSFFAFFIAIATLTSCKKGDQSSSSVSSSTSIETFKPIKNDWVVLWLGANPSTLNPILKSDAVASDVVAYIFDTLVSYDARTGEPEGRLADHWEISKDG